MGCQRDISAWILKAVLYPPVNAYSGPRQASQMELLARIVVNVFKLMLLTIFSKNSTVDIAVPDNTSNLF